MNPSKTLPEARFGHYRPFRHEKVSFSLDFYLEPYNASNMIIGGFTNHCSGRVIKTGTAIRPCPWCLRPLEFARYPQSVRFTCRCGYAVTECVRGMGDEEKEAYGVK